jgi:hypothetical protein
VICTIADRATGATYSIDDKLAGRNLPNRSKVEDEVYGMRARIAVAAKAKAQEVDRRGNNDRHGGN